MGPDHVFINSKSIIHTKITKSHKGVEKEQAQTILSPVGFCLPHIFILRVHKLGVYSRRKSKIHFVSITFSTLPFYSILSENIEHLLVRSSIMQLLTKQLQSHHLHLQ